MPATRRHAGAGKDEQGRDWPSFRGAPPVGGRPVCGHALWGKAPELDKPETYDASFLLANQRVRGVGYEPIGHKNFRFKKHIPKGWHMNVCDPNLPTNDPKQNIHHPLKEFSTTDFRDFINQTAKMWKIDLGGEWEGELFS